MGKIVRVEHIDSKQRMINKGQPASNWSETTHFSGVPVSFGEVYGMQVLDRHQADWISSHLSPMSDVALTDPQSKRGINKTKLRTGCKQTPKYLMTGAKHPQSNEVYQKGRRKQNEKQQVELKHVKQDKNKSKYSRT